MPATQLQSIFLGVTPAEQRKFIALALRHLREGGSKRVVIPAVGQFTLAKCALQAGFEPGNVITSDISFYSSLLGFVISGQPIEGLHATLAEDLEIGGTTIHPRKAYEAYRTDLERAAYLLWLLKLRQLKSNLYEQVMFREYFERGPVYREKLIYVIAGAASRLKGIQYRVRDLREEMRDDWDADTVLIINPPAYSAGSYAKMFPLEGMITFPSPAVEFNWSKEYKALYAESAARDFPTIWYKKYVEMDGIPADHAIFAKELANGDFDLWLCTKPERLSSMKERGAVSFVAAKPLNRYRNMPTWGMDDDLRPDSKVVFIKSTEEHSLYYRDLWAHRLGDTKAEIYFLIAIDGKVFGTVGFHCSEWRRNIFDKILLMYLITCTQMRDVLTTVITRYNRFWPMVGLRTTCLAKYRSVKLNNGLLKITKREKMENGLYKLMYECDFRDERFGGALRAYLTEFESNRGPGRRGPDDSNTTLA